MYVWKFVLKIYLTFEPPGDVQSGLSPGGPHPGKKYWYGLCDTTMPHPTI